MHSHTTSQRERLPRSGPKDIKSQGVLQAVRAQVHYEIFLRFSFKLRMEAGVLRQQSSPREERSQRAAQDKQINQINQDKTSGIVHKTILG